MSPSYRLLGGMRGISIWWKKCLIFYLVVIVKTPSSGAYPILLIGCVLSVHQPKQMLHIFDFNLLVDTRKKSWWSRDSNLDIVGWKSRRDKMVLGPTQRIFSSNIWSTQTQASSHGGGNWRALYFLFPGSYVCSFNDSQDRISPESNSKVYIFVFDEINLLTHSGFDFQQSVAYKSAQIPCRWGVPP